MGRIWESGANPEQARCGDPTTSGSPKTGLDAWNPSATAVGHGTVSGSLDMPHAFPFCAVVGADDLQLALILTSISPAIGGVLVRGEKGTAKTTTVRALAGVLPPIDVIAGDRFSADPRDAADVAMSPDGPFGLTPAIEERPVRLVELPVGATEDRVLGSIHLQSALSEGHVEYEPGLLARAHRGILYVDEINLLHDHLVDLLLDAAATGRANVERDGVSLEHAARFVLVGTMNPEEGELRPQLLDRFGLTVEVSAPRDPAVRAEIVSRRLAFDADPEGFSAQFEDDQTTLGKRLSAARTLLPEVELTAATLLQIAEICAAFGVDGMRADIVTARAAAAHAAWAGRADITRDDIAVGARLALPHRRRRNPFDAPGLDEQQLEELLGDDPTDDQPDPDPSGADPATPPAPSDIHDDSPTDQTSNQDRAPGAGNPSSTTSETAGDPSRAKLFRAAGLGYGESGRRSRAITDIGRRVGAAPAGSGGGIALIDTIRAAVPHQHARGRSRGRLLLAADDLRASVREGRESNLVLLCVDASGSMAAKRRMRQVKAAVLSLLLDAYQRRDKVALVTFRGHAADLTLPPTGSVDVAKRRLDDLPAGGRTPLAEGLRMAWEVAARERLRDPRRRPLLVVVTDGRATSGTDPLPRAHAVADRLAADNIDTLVVDCESGGMRLGLARTLAEHLRGQYTELADVTAEGLTRAIVDRLPRREDVA